MIVLRIALNSKRKKGVDEKAVGLYKRAFLYYKKYGFKKFYQRLLKEPRNFLRRNLHCQRYVLVERNLHKALFPILPPLLPINFSLLNEDILDKTNISLLGNKEAVLMNLKKGDIYFISQYKDKIIAYIWLTLQGRIIPGPPIRLRLRDKEIYCANIITLNEYRGKGVIPDAIYKGFEILKQLGYQRVYGIIPYKNRPALRNAQRCGFSQIRRIVFLNLLAIRVVL